MKPTEAGRKLEEIAAKARQGAEPDAGPLVEAAREVAALLKANASRSGHSIAVRVVEKHNGVRLTVTGPHAGRYKALAEREMNARAVGAKAEVRAQITRRAK